MPDLHKLRKDSIARLMKTPGRYRDGTGLFLQVVATNKGTSAIWVYTFSLKGKQRWMSLGPVSDLNNIDRARKRAAELRDMVKVQRLDPSPRGVEAANHAHHEASRFPTFAEASEAYINANVKRLVNGKWIGEFNEAGAKRKRQLIRDMIPERIKVTPVDKLTPADFEQVLRPTWAGVDACNNAAKLRRDCESVLNRAFTLGGLEKRNPASWETLKAVLPSIQAKVKQRAYLKPNEARELYRRLAADDREQCRMIRLAMLSGCRVEEILTARWDDIDYKTGCWTVPTHIDGKAVTKATRAGHFANFVPLSTAARALLGEHKGNGRVFSIRSAQTLLNVYTGYGMKGDVTNHGARSTMSDIGTEELGVALHGAKRESG